jgi:putative NIF3 family GTP cyclohydrolase 1 type 2
VAVMTARSLAERIEASLKAPAPGSKEGDDGFRAGDPSANVQRIVVCQSPSAAVIKRTRPGERTLIVSREDPFYFTHDTAGSTPNMDWSNGLSAEVARNPITAVKRALIEGRGAVCYRLSSAWDTARPAAQSQALAQALGVTPAAGPDATTAYGTVAPVTLERLGLDISTRLKIRSLRAHGDPKLVVRKVAVLNGLVAIHRLAGALADSAVDAVILGETCEWEATPYFDDLISGGRRVGMLLTGYQTSDRFGMRAMADFIRSVAGGVPVELAEHEEPGWIA